MKPSTKWAALSSADQEEALDVLRGAIITLLITTSASSGDVGKDIARWTALQVAVTVLEGARQ